MICLSGIIWYCGSKSQLKQLIDLPSNIEGAKDGKGNRRIIIYVARTLNLIMIVGILRSGGDTLFSMIMELSSLWGVGLTLGSIGAFVFKLDVLYVFLLFETEQFVKVVVGFIRYRQKKWVRNIALREEISY